MRKLPEGAEAANVLVGEVPSLSKSFLVVLRFKNPEILHGFTEVHVKTRFLFLLLGPAQQTYENQYYDIGRSWSTLLCDEVWLTGLRTLRGSVPVGERGTIIACLFIKTGDRRC